MINAILWLDATSDTCPLAWSEFSANDLDGAYEWMAQQQANYVHGFVRIFNGRRQLLCQKSW